MPSCSEVCFLSFLLHYFCPFVKPSFSHVTTYAVPFAWNALIAKPSVASTFSNHDYSTPLFSDHPTCPSLSLLQCLLQLLLENSNSSLSVVILFMFCFLFYSWSLLSLPSCRILISSLEHASSSVWNNIWSKIGVQQMFDE